MILVARLMEEDGRMDFDATYRSDMHYDDMHCGIFTW